MREFNLKNNIRACVKENKNTPRVALTLNFSITKPEKYSGEYSIMNRLLLKGTEKYSSEELSAILDENAIDFSTEMKSDYLRFRFVCLNEDFEKALSILKEVILHSTFEEFDKEKTKLKGELTAELDSAKVKVSDLFTKTIYKNHFYGNSYTKILEEIDNVTKEDVIASYREILNNSQKTAAIAGDIDVDFDLIDKYLGQDIPEAKEAVSLIPIPQPLEQEYTEIIKEDANQAQILQGWRVPTIGDDEYPVIMLLNVILGASGLSSRLFLELREKKGLAYTVRTAYETHKKSAVFSIYIGTEPSNIQTSIDGFKEEIEKIKTIPVSEEELKNAVNNLIGKQQYVTETNSQQANMMAYYSIMGKPFDYQAEIIEKLHKVTPKDLQDCANKYFTDDYILSVIKP
jgi:predicted Zn-dependent peptidase